MRSIVGHSDDIDTPQAVREVIEQCEARLDGEAPKAALLFASVEYDHAPALEAISKRWPGIALIGGTTDGEVSSAGGYHPDSVLLVLLVGDEIEACVGLGRHMSSDPERAVREATSVLAGRKPALCLTTFAPTANSSDIVRRIEQVAGADCPILGGLTGDHREFTRMSEFCGSEALQDALPVLYLFGDLKVSWGVSSGWFPIGEFRRITKSDGNIVHEIDGRPALEVFRHYWGEIRTDSLGEYPLATYPNGPDGPYALRAALGCDEATGAIRFAGEAAEGAHVRLTEVLPAGLLSGTAASIERALASYPGASPSIVLLFSCAARRWVLGPQATRELEILSQSLAGQANELLSVAGFYCFGEIAPLNGGGVQNAFHNETCVTVVLGS